MNRKFNEYLGDSRENVLQIAAKLEVAESTVWRWLRGKNRPVMSLRRAIARETDGAVPVKSWGES